MSLDETARSAVARALVNKGLPNDAALDIAARLGSKQKSEWPRILDRCQRGKVSRLYIVVTEIEGQNDVLVYIPNGIDSVERVKDFASQGPAIGEQCDDRAHDTAEDVRFRYYPVFEYDVAAEVCAAIQQAQ